MSKNKFKLTTPVLFLVFNRLDTTKKVFEEIKKAKPKELFVAVDIFLYPSFTDTFGVWNNRNNGFWVACCY